MIRIGFGKTTALLILTLAAAVGCSSQDAQSAPAVSAAPSTSVTPAVTAEPTPSQTPTPTVTESFTPSATPTAPTDGVSEAGESATELPSDDSTNPPVLDRQASGRDLTLSDFFSTPDSWRDGRFDVAGKLQIPGISGQLYSCRDDQSNHDELELRLANNFNKISMSVAQADDSETSDSVLNVRLVGNGKYIDSARVPFNRIEKFSAPVTSVNALKIEVWKGGENCESGDVGAVLAGLRLE